VAATITQVVRAPKRPVAVVPQPAVSG
jgi:hypothetical protein